jgi:hypothetical protein
VVDLVGEISLVVTEVGGGVMLVVELEEVGGYGFFFPRRPPGLDSLNRMKSGALSPVSGPAGSSMNLLLGYDLRAKERGRPKTGVDRQKPPSSTVEW